MFAAIATVGVAAVLLLEGCSDDYASQVLAGVRPQPARRDHDQFDYTTMNRGYQLAAPPHIEERMEAVRGSAMRYNARSDELRMLVQSLDSEYSSYMKDLNTVTRELDTTRNAAALGYGEYMRGLREVAGMQASNPRDAVFVSSSRVNLQPVPPPPSSPASVVVNVENNLTPPAATLQRSLQTSSQDISSSSGRSDGIASTPVPLPPTVDPVPPNAPASTFSNQAVDSGLANYAAMVSTFLDSCLVLAPTNLVSQLTALKTELAAQRVSLSTHGLADLATRVNALIPLINQSRGLEKSGSEVWIDASLINRGKERKRLLDLMFTERNKKGYISSDAREDGDESVSVPSLFTLSSRWVSHGDRLRVFKEAKRGRVKIVGVCGRKNSKQGPYMYSFTCEDPGRSISLLADSRRHNTLAGAVLKVTCKSKDFARKLVFDQRAKQDRCFISRWSQLAPSAPEKKSRRKSQEKAFDMLTKGEGCFSSDESSIEIDCLKQSKRKNKSRNP